MNRLYVTALIDTYNHGRFIAEAIESVLAQDFPASEMEIVVVDDGSTDGTREQVLRLGDRVRYIYKENGGQASALNLGIAEARGEFIALLDADDLWLPEKLRRVVDAFEKHPEAAMVYHPQTSWLMEDDRCVEDRSYLPISGYLPDRPENMLLFNGISTSAMTLRREHALQLLPIPEGCRVLADAYLISTVLFLAPVVAVGEYLTRYRRHGANLTAVPALDAVRLRRMVESSSAATCGAGEWLQRRGWKLSDPAPRMLLERRELLVRFAGYPLTPPGRLDLFRDLRQLLRLNRPIWSPRYCLYRRALALACLALGYGGYSALQRWYGRNPAPQALRKRLFPSDSALEPAQAP